MDSILRTAPMYLFRERTGLILSDLELGKNTLVFLNTKNVEWNHLFCTVVDLLSCLFQVRTIADKLRQGCGDLEVFSKLCHAGFVIMKPSALHSRVFIKRSKSIMHKNVSLLPCI